MIRHCKLYPSLFGQSVVHADRIKDFKTTRWKVGQVQRPLNIFKLIRASYSGPLLNRDEKVEAAKHVISHPFAVYVHPA